MGNTVESAGSRATIFCCRSRGRLDSFLGSYDGKDDLATDDPFYGGDEFDYENGLGPSL